jgi:hypothetical protein
MDDAVSFSRGTDRSALRAGVVVASLAAGAIHAAVVPEHLEEFWVFGLFFIASAVFQIGWAIAAFVAPSRAVYTIGALANAFLIATWMLSRTAGVPIGPEAWTPESVGTLDVVSTVAEAAIVLGSLIAVRGGGDAEAPGGRIAGDGRDAANR